MTAPELPLRPAVGIVLFSAEGRVFVGRRVRGQAGTWQMPQGGIDEGETALQAALRELHEETGIDRVEVMGELPEWLVYALPPDLPDPPRWSLRYRGQRQRWFAMRFLGADDDIDLAVARPEFDAWRWVPLAEVAQLVVPFKRAVYERVAQAFEGYATGASATGASATAGIAPDDPADGSPSAATFNRERANGARP